MSLESAVPLSTYTKFCKRPQRHGLAAQVRLWADLKTPMWEMQATEGRAPAGIWWFQKYAQSPQSSLLHRHFAGITGNRRGCKLLLREGR